MATMSTNHVSVRLDAETMARVDALSPLFSTKWRGAPPADILPGALLSPLPRVGGVAPRADILRGLILSALDRFEGEHAAETAPARARSQRAPRPGAQSQRAP